MKKQTRYAMLAIAGLVAGTTLMGYAITHPIQTVYSDRAGFDNRAAYIDYKAGVLDAMDSPYVVSYTINAMPSNNSMRWTAVVELGYALPYGTDKARADYKMILPGALLVLFSIILGLPYMYRLATRRRLPL